ncbi:hypothetical protein [Treponema sp. R80B11-R83G3]
MVDKEKIEKAIEDINGLLLDFGNAVDELRGVRELLYSLIEEEPENEKRNC